MSDEVRKLAARIAARLERIMVSLAKIEEEIEAMLGELTQQPAEPPGAPDAGAEGQKPPQEDQR